MANNRGMARGSFIIFIFLLLPTSIFAEPDPRCTQLYEEWDNENVRLDELKTAVHEIENTFDNSVKADFHSQSEGQDEALHRKKALKAAFEKKQLQKSLRAQESKTLKAKEKLCRECKEVTRPVPCESK